MARVVAIALLGGACSGLLAGCTDSRPASSTPVLTVRAQAGDPAEAYFATACSACHEEGARACLQPSFFEGGRLTQRYEEIPAHTAVPVPESMRTALSALSD